MVEMQKFNKIMTICLDYATRQTRCHIPMTMADYVSKLNTFLQFNDAEIFAGQGKK